MNAAFIDGKCSVCGCDINLYITDGEMIECPQGHENGIWRGPKDEGYSAAGRLFGRGVREMRRAKNIDLTEAATAAGMTIVRLSDIERGSMVTREELDAMKAWYDLPFPGDE